MLINDKEGKLADLQVDNEVQVTYEKEGDKLIATARILRPRVKRKVPRKLRSRPRIDRWLSSGRILSIASCRCR